MHDLEVVRKALMKSRIKQISAEDQDSIISVLIYDIFGGEILKTKSRNGWHFYNRVEGRRLDFSKSDFGTPSAPDHFEDIPVSSDEAASYFEAEQFLFFLMKFIRYFEEIVGLQDDDRTGYSTRVKKGRREFSSRILTLNQGAGIIPLAASLNR